MGISSIYKIIAATASAAALFAFGWLKGMEHVQGKWDAETARIALADVNLELYRTKETVRVVTEYVDRVQVVREKGATIVKEVKVYVPDDRCTVPVGFVRVHNAAATGGALIAPGIIDAAPAGIALSDVAGTVTSNYTRCRENAEQLIALQEWVRAMQVQESPK